MLKRFSILSLLTFLLLCFQGCSDDILDILPDNGGLVDNEPGLHIYLPSNVNTRAMSESAPTTAEKQLKTVYLFAYDAATTNTEPVQVFELKDGTAVGNYTKYTISNLRKNKSYYYFVVANIFETGKESDLKSSYASKETLKSKILSYSADIFAYPNTTTGAAKGLPMSCDNGSMFVPDDNSTEKTYFGSNVARLFNGTESLAADLIFCVAKVTVNVEKPAGDYCDLTEATLSDYATTFPVLTTDSKLATTTSGLKIEGNSLKKLSTGVPEDSKTYTFYVPENTFSERKKSNLKIKFKDENETELTVDIPLGEKDGNNNRLLDRGCHYEYLLDSKGNISLNVYSWVNKAIDAEVGGPFYLRISTSEIASMKSGVKYAMTFDTDVTAENFSLEPPKYVDANNKEYPAFIFTKNFKERKFTVQINDAIPLSVWKDETKSKALRYFHVVANNLKKRVDIGEIEAEPSFTVNPQTVVIDLRELIAGGYSKYLYNVEYASNIGEVESTWSTARWKNASGDVLSSYTSSTVDNIFVPTATASASSGTDGVNVYQLDQGVTFYADRKYLEVTYEVKMPADASADDITLFNKLKQNNGHKKTVRYTVIPYSSNYIIHFRSDVNESNWTNPHIYAYQCLELPVDLKGTNAKYAGKTVGDEYGGELTAALKYCFTSGIAFKGWKGYGGPETNDPNATGTWGRDANNKVLNEGFFKFSSGTIYLPNIGKPNESYLNTTRYDWYGFNNPHYKNLIDAQQGKGQAGNKCSKGHCSTGWNPTPGKCTENIRLWPGIIMQEERIDGKTWWKYELSGVAEPGKTLLMFANGHEGSDDRFPKHLGVGVPLFDYEDKEGWFVLKENGGENHVKNRFYDDNPYATNGEGEDDPVIVVDPYTLYWPKTKDGVDFKYLYDCSNGTYNEITDTETIGDVTYYVATVNGNSGKYMLKGVTDWSDNNKMSHDIQLSASSFSEDDKCATIKLTDKGSYNGDNNQRYRFTVTPGKPKVEVNKEYCIYYQRYYGNDSDKSKNEITNFSLWINGGSKLIEAKNGNNCCDDHKYVEFNHTGDENATLMYWGGNGYSDKYGGDKTLNITLSDFTYDEGIKKYVANIWDNTGHKVAPHPTVVITVNGDYNMAYSGDKKNIHYWGTTPSSAWPGVEMTVTATGSDNKSYKIFNVPEGSSILFNTNGNDSKTGDFAFTKGYIYDDNGKTLQRVVFKKLSSARRKTKRVVKR